MAKTFYIQASMQVRGAWVIPSAPLYKMCAQLTCGGSSINDNFAYICDEDEQGVFCQTIGRTPSPIIEGQSLYEVENDTELMTTLGWSEQQNEALIEYLNGNPRDLSKVEKRYETIRKEMVEALEGKTTDKHLKRFACMMYDLVRTEEGRSNFFLRNGLEAIRNPDRITSFYKYQPGQFMLECLKAIKSMMIQKVKTGLVKIAANVIIPDDDDDDADEDVEMDIKCEEDFVNTDEVDELDIYIQACLNDGEQGDRYGIIEEDDGKMSTYVGLLTREFDTPGLTEWHRKHVRKKRTAPTREEIQIQKYALQQGRPKQQNGRKKRQENRK